MPARHFSFKLWISVLTLLSGFINVASIRSFSMPVSHHTGNISKIAILISDGNITIALRTIVIIISFFSGAFLSGLLFHQREFKLKKCYGILLMIIGVFFTGLHFIKLPQSIQVLIISFLAGMQNAMFIYHGEILVRTTHMTGYLTDAAFALAMLVRGKKDKLRFFSFYTLNILLFFIGGIFANIVQVDFFFIILAFAYFVIGLYYFIMRKKILI